MAQNNVYCDADDSTSNITVESSEIDCNEVQNTQYQSNNDRFGINAANLNLPVLDKASISHISSVALQNSSDITFGNKMTYGPITVNQYGCEKTDFERKTKRFYKRWRILLAIAITVVMLVIVATILILHFQNTDDEIPNIDNDDTPLKMFTRNEWKAVAPTGVVDDLITPVPLVMIQHSVQSSCFTKETCAPLVKQIQIQHINSPKIGDDIGYNFLVGGDGAAYVGRGWDKIGAHTQLFNSKSIGVGFIGDFRYEKPTNQQIVALLKLIRDGVEMNKISVNYSLIGANQVQQTESPGKYLIEIITKLPHWSDEVHRYE